MRKIILVLFVICFVVGFGENAKTERKNEVVTTGGMDIKYPPYPNVWEREFAYSLNDPNFHKMVDGDIVVDSRYLSYDNNRMRKDSEYKRKSLLFYKNKYIEEKKLSANINWNEEEYTSYESSGGKEFEKCMLKTKDGERIYGDYRFIVKNENGFDSFSNLYDTQEYREVAFVLYLKVPVLLKDDKDGKNILSKVYLYYLPRVRDSNFSHRNQYPKDEIYYSFMYFQRGEIAIIDEDNIFLIFRGSKKIIRLDKNGDTKSKDRNLVIFEYEEYKNNVLKYMDYNSQNVWYEKYPTGKIGKYLIDYDYTGEVLAKKIWLRYKFA